MAEYIDREAIRSALYNEDAISFKGLRIINQFPAADVVEVVRCKDCANFETNVWAAVDGIPLIVAHEMCKFWGKGCKTGPDGYCSFGRRKHDG